MKIIMKFFVTLGALMVLGLGSQAQAILQIEQLEYKQMDTVLHGYLVYDGATKGQRPGVLVVHEWWGLNDYAKKRAEALARKGYIALALDMYGQGKTTEHPKQAGEWAAFVRQNEKTARERFVAAYELLQNHKLTKRDKIAAIGYCFGGSVVLSMAQEGMALRGVVSFHGSFPTKRAEPNTIKAKILVCHGADDPMTTQDQVHQFQENLKHARADWQFMVYGGAKHSFTNPEADKRGIPGLAYNGSADKRSWKAMLAFFDEIFLD
jgi:dienelactone hydrolase